MPIRLRLARHGQRHTPVYHLVAINATKRRDAKPIEKLGEYDPLPRVPREYKLPTATQVFGKQPILPKEKRIEWDVDRINYWLSVGAQPTKTVVRLLERGGILKVPHRWQHKWSHITTGQTLPSPEQAPAAYKGAAAAKAAPSAPTPESAPKAPEAAPAPKA